MMLPQFKLDTMLKDASDVKKRLAHNAPISAPTRDLIGEVCDHVVSLIVDRDCAVQAGPARYLLGLDAGGMPLAYAREDENGWLVWRVGFSLGDRADSVTQAERVMKGLHCTDIKKIA